MRRFLLKIILIQLVLVFSGTFAHAKTGKPLKGRVLEAGGNPISNVLIKASPSQKSVLTNEAGKFSLSLDSGTYELSFSHVRFQVTYRKVSIPTSQELVVLLQERTSILESVEINENAIDLLKDQHIMKVKPKNVLNLPTATGDFSKILATLPGVNSNNELSSTYSVRGGNYDENLVYVNGIKIYRPQIITAGRQEGLSFINPDMVRGIEFSAGGWRARYGDKLSSMLNVGYKEPTSYEGRVNLSLLGGSLYAGGRSKNQNLTFATGIRHKNSRYLLGTLDVDGEYFPRFTDAQTYMSQRLSDKTKISLLGAVALNNYQTIPSFQQTTFGTAEETLRLNVAFDGQELLNYQTYQLAGLIKHSFTENLISNLSVSRVNSSERENYDLEAGYRLCEISGVPGTDQFNECVSDRGIGTNYRFGRNKLEANILNVEQRNELYINNDLLEFGVSWDYEVLTDRLQEYSFTDSSDFVTIDRTVDNNFDLDSHKIAAFGQYTLTSFDSVDIVNFGVRMNYWTFSEQLLLSPRIQYAHIFKGANINTLRLSLGIYSQHPFYRELRDREGNIQSNVRAQRSLHVIGGWDRYFSMWGRPFKMTIDAYSKYIWDANLYDIDNVRIRYFANNDARAYAHGMDFRINGEFVKGAESWFSIGFLSTREAPNDSSSYVRRPTDQRVNLGIFYQDHIPNDPSIRVNLNLLYGTGLPFGPPGNDQLRSALVGDNYFRVDIGFTKHFKLTATKKVLPRKIVIGLEVLNMLATENAISYTWIQDVNSAQFAIPNTLSNRFFNLRVVGEF